MAIVFVRPAARSRPGPLLAWLGTLVTLVTFACHARPLDPEVSALNLRAGETFYLKSSIFQEKDRYRTTNYRRGLLVPVNTAVTLVKADDRRIVVTLAESKRQLTVENVPKHTNETVPQAFATLFAEQPVDLSRYSPDERTAIESGRAEPGMDKDAVLVAMGRPPYSLTPSLDAADWVYQENQIMRLRVHFDADGKVTGVGHR